MRNKKERQRLKEEFIREVSSGKKTLSEASSARLLNALHAKIEARVSNALEARTSETRQSRIRYRPSQPDTAASASRPAAPALVHTAWFRWSAAAIVLLLAGVLWRSQQPHPAIAVSSPANSSPTMTLRSNEDSRDLSLTLPDGSAVVLSPGSSIRYYPAFEPGHRNILLSGKAIFDVAIDAARPFTVYAGNINTTALGTRFIVSTLSPDKVQVHLLEGKVVIKPSDSKLAMKDVFLVPGQLFVLNSKQQQFAVTAFTDSSANNLTQKKKQTPAISGTLTDTSILEFDQEPLPEVLTAIGRKYRVVFRLNGHEFNTIQVTGKFLGSDSLPSVLSMLGALNGLSFTAHNDTIVVAPARP